MFFVYGFIYTTIFLILYNIIKMKCVKELSTFIVLLHCLLLLFSVYPIFSTTKWNEDFWIVCAASELLLVLFTIIIFRLDYRNLRIYEALNRSKMITLFIGTYSILRRLEIEEMLKRLESLFTTDEKYKVPYNIVIIGKNNNHKEKVDFKFIFWNQEDYNKFIGSNKDLVIEEYARKRYGIYLATSIDVKTKILNK